MMSDIYSPLLLMSTAAAILYMVLRLLTKWTQKHFTAAWHYYSHVLLSSFFLIPFYKLFTYLDMNFAQTVQRSFEIGSVVSPVQTVVQNLITHPLELQFSSNGTEYEPSHVLSYLFGLLPYVLAAGTLTFIAVILIQNIRLHLRITKICELADDPVVIKEFAACKREMGIIKEIPVYVSPYISTPFLSGLFKPRIVLPGSMDFTADQYRQVFLHELTHYKRHDIWLKCLLILIHALHWFNPFAYMARRDTDRYCELSCDERIVQTMNSTEKRQYCELLLSVLWNAADQKVRLISAFSEKGKYLERRIKMILKSEASKKKKSIRILAVAMTLSIALIGTAAAYAASKDGTPNYSEAAAAASKAEAHVQDESIILKGDVGTIIRHGNLIFERVENNSSIPPENLTIKESEHDFSVSLKGTEESQRFTLTRDNEYCKIWIQNANSGHIIFTITQHSPTGTVMPGGIAVIPASSTWTVANSNPWGAAIYYANFTAGKINMSGQAASRSASTFAHLSAPLPHFQ